MIVRFLTTWVPPVVAIAFCGAAGADLLRLNLSASMPLGLWRVVAASDPVRRGEVVLACAPAPLAEEALARGTLIRGHGCPNGIEPLLKPVAAIAGDVVEVTGEAVLINGVSVVPSGRPLDWRGQPLHPMPAGLYPVRPGTLWLLSSHPGSWDSRYFGPLPTSQVLAEARPLLVAEP